MIKCVRVLARACVCRREHARGRAFTREPGRDEEKGEGACLGIRRRNLCPYRGIYISIIRIYIRGMYTYGACTV